MQSHLLLVGSILIGSLLLLAMANMSSTMSSRSVEHLLENLVRRNTDGITEIMLQDFRRMGLSAPNPENVILSFNNNSIRFLGDINADGSLDTLQYALSETSAASNTQNPRDRLLYRWMNSEPQQDIAIGVTNFNLNYYDKNGSIATIAATIATVEIQLTVESLFGCSVADSIYYPQNFWQTRITPPNLIR